MDDINILCFERTTSHLVCALCLNSMYIRESSFVGKWPEYGNGRIQSRLRLRFMFLEIAQESFLFEKR